jgi:hypothetical protein
MEGTKERQVERFISHLAFGIFIGKYLCNTYNYHAFWVRYGSIYVSVAVGFAILAKFMSQKGGIFMGKANLDRGNILEKISEIQKSLELLKRDIIKSVEPSREIMKTSLYGSVKGGDITEDMIEEAKQTLFRELEDIK